MTILGYAGPRGAADAPSSRVQRWAGWFLGVVPCLLLLFSAVMKLARHPEVIKGFADLGWPDRLAVPIGVVELVSTIIYLVPQTAVLGAILLSGYLGGAMATHLRLGQPVYMQFLMGAVLWLGLFLRDRRLRALLPLRRTTPADARHAPAQAA